MNFTVSTIAQSLSAYLSPSFSGVTFCQDPNQQGANPPRMFLQQRYSFLERRQAGRWLRTIGLDLVYEADYNLTNLQQIYQNAAETLDLLMETFPYTDGVSESTTLLRIYDREWRVELNAMHYKFELQNWVELPETVVPMGTMEYNPEVLYGN